MEDCHPVMCFSHVLGMKPSIFVGGIGCENFLPFSIHSVWMCQKYILHLNGASVPVLPFVPRGRMPVATPSRHGGQGSYQNGFALHVPLPELSSSCRRLLSSSTDLFPLISGSCDTQVVHDLGVSPFVFDAHEDLPCHLPGR